MNSEILLEALGEVKDEFIKEAKNKNNSKKNLYVIMGAIAACLVLFFFIPNIPNFFGMGAQEGDIFRNGYLIEDITLSQLSESYNGRLLAKNLIGDRDFEFYSKTSDFSENSDDWYSLLYSEYNTDSKIIMHCMFGEKAEDWKIDMVFTDEATKTVEINGVNVEIAKFDLSLQYSFCYYALFDYDGAVYDLRVYSDDENMIINVLKELIR